VLTLEGVVTRYGAVCALDGVGLEVAEGTLTAVLGANGAGKTTLLRTVSGLVRPVGGRVLLRGRDLTRVPAEQMVRRGVAHVPEGRGVITELTVAENLRLGALWRRDRRAATGAVREAYRLFPVLAERGRQPAGALSGGERQMLAIGRALVAEPSLLLLDEPSLGLAPRVTRQIMAVVDDLRRRRGLTVLLVEQNARIALSVADQVVVLSRGRVVAVDRPAAFAEDVALRHAYLGF
jgi:branched-chain amino acid transport system ATP-binding protein